MVHRRRSALIAQTELAYAYNNGQQALIEEAVKNGTIAPGATKVWYTAADERVCESCGKLDMQEVPWDATFSNGKVTAPAHPNCRCAVAYTKLKSLAPPPKQQLQPQTQPESELKNPAEYGILHTGALNGFGKKADAHARRYYAAVRKMKTDVIRIAQNTGWSVKSIQAIKDHIFNDLHEIDGEMRAFDPSYFMAESWQRLIQGGKEIREQDIVLLKHEYLERTFEKRGVPHEIAHELAQEKHNYSKYLPRE